MRNGASLKNCRIGKHTHNTYTHRDICIAYICIYIYIRIVISYHIISYHIISHHIISFHIRSHHIIYILSYHIIIFTLYHIISYYIIIFTLYHIVFYLKKNNHIKYIYIYVYMHVCMYIYIYKYIYLRMCVCRKRERERERSWNLLQLLCPKVDVDVRLACIVDLISSTLPAWNARTVQQVSGLWLQLEAAPILLCECACVISHWGFGATQHPHEVVAFDSSIQDYAMEAWACESTGKNLKMIENGLAKSKSNGGGGGTVLGERWRKIASG